MRWLARLLRWLAALVDRPRRPARPTQTEKFSGQVDFKELGKTYFSEPGHFAQPSPVADLWWTYYRGWYPTDDVTPFTPPRDGDLF